MATFKGKLENLGASHAECGRGGLGAGHVESRWLALPPMCALRGLAPQILNYIHQFNTSTSSRAGPGLEAVRTRGQLYSSLPDELEVPGQLAKQESPKPGPLAQGLGSPRCMAFCILWGFLNYCPDGELD